MCLSILLCPFAWANEISKLYIVNIVKAQKLGFYDEAIRLLESSNNKDSPEDLNRLGWLLIMQQKGSEENKVRGFVMIQRAASLKYQPAMADLAAFYVDETLSGKFPDFQTSPAKWKRLMEEASALGYGFASKSLASAYMSGKYSLRRDTREACINAKLAEDQGLYSMPMPFSLNNLQYRPERDLNWMLSYCYETGAGGLQDLNLALAYAYLSESDNEVFNTMSEKDRKSVGHQVQYEKIASKIAPEEIQAAYEFVRKWLEERNTTIPVVLRNDLPADPHILANRLAKVSQSVNMVKISSIEAQLEKGADLLTLNLMSKRGDTNLSSSNARLKPIYKQLLHDVRNANRQLIKQLTEEEKSREAIETYFEKALTVNELRELVAFYEGQNGKTYARGISLMMEISHKAALKMADLYASNPNNVKETLQEMENKFQIEKSGMEIERASVIKEASVGMSRFSEALRMVPWGIGMMGAGRSRLELSERMDDWIDFFVLDGGDRIFGRRSGYVFIINKEQNAIREWMSNARMSPAWKEYYQALRDIAHKPLAEVHNKGMRSTNTK
jgi:hypothetical protein